VLACEPTLEQGRQRGVGRFATAQPQRLREPASGPRQGDAILQARDQIQMPHPAGNLRGADPAASPQVGGKRAEIMPSRTRVISELLQDGTKLALYVGHADAPTQAFVAVTRLGEQVAGPVVVPGHPGGHGLFAADIGPQQGTFRAG
jgi:hypothetical protein